MYLYIYTYIKLIDGELKTDLFLKPTYTHQFLDPPSSYPYQCKKWIPYSQALGLNGIGSDNANFDKRYNDLEKWLMERSYNKKMIRKQILRFREHSRNDLLEKATNVWAKTNIQHYLLSRFSKC